MDPPVSIGEGHRLAVLPLVNLSPSASEEYFSDGLTEEIISSLSRIPSLQVVARTSAMHYKGSRKTVAEIATELQARSVLEGSVRKAGRQLRATVRLIDPTTQAELWSGEYDRELEDLFELQREIAERVAGALRLTLARREVAVRPRSSPAEADAYNLYLQGRFEWNRRTEHGLRRAIALFEQALEKDRRFALAFSGIADAYAQLGWHELASPTDAFPRARAAAEAALAIDDHLAEAHASLGFVSFLYERDWATAEKELVRAVSLNEGYPAAHQFYADYLKAMGRWSEALEQMRRAVALDPLSMSIRTGLGHVLYLSGDNDAAIEEYRHALAIDPTFAPAHLWFGRPYLQKGLYDEAIAEVRKAVELSGGSTISLAVLAHAYSAAGRKHDAARILKQLLERSRTQYVPSYWIALVFTGLGETDHAIAWLERACDERSSWLVWIKVEPRFEGLRSDPRFHSLLRRMRLEEDPSTAPVRPPADRQLVALMFTDLVGFTKLAQQDETAALRLLEEHRSLVRPIVASHGGREVKTLGDGFLLEFASAVESVRCAIEIQDAMGTRNEGRPVPERLRLRIGVHVGDVVREGVDLVGDGVNVASRIQPLAPPGGICITGQVLDQIRNKVEVGAQRVPDARLKNVSSPVEVYRLVRPRRAAARAV